jgi:hypothetical protein
MLNLGHVVSGRSRCSDHPAGCLDDLARPVSTTVVAFPATMPRADVDRSRSDLIETGLDDAWRVASAARPGARREPNQHGCDDLLHIDFLSR